MSNPLLELVKAVAEGKVSEKDALEDVKASRKPRKRSKNVTWAYAKCKAKSHVSPNRRSFSLGYAQLNWDKLGG